MGQNSEMQENACRLCEETSPIMHSVFERVPEGQQILQLIKEFLKLLIYRTDPLPKQICEDCYTNLANFSSLKRISSETLERQRERLIDCNSDSNVSIQLFLNALEQNNFQSNDNDFNPIHNETELCDELQQAIQDSLRKSKIQENHIEDTKLLNGYSESQDDDSQSSSQHKENQGTDSPYSLSHNAESQSDMEICDSDSEFTPRILTRKISGKRFIPNKRMISPIQKRRRFIGPKSRVKQRKDNYIRLFNEQEHKKNVLVKYNPLSLMKCVLNCINKQNLPQYQCDHFVKIEINEVFVNDDLMLEEENICNYCDKLFMSVNALAKHESLHMYVVLGEKVDNLKMWHGRRTDAQVRNKWLNSINESNESDEEDMPRRATENFEDSTGRVNVINPEDVLFRDSEEANNDHQELLVPRETPNLKGEVVLIDTKATVNGIPLGDISKDDRRTLYVSVTVNGVKRKFCPLCRYTFKDNWAIESHYFSTACHYTCRFCGVRFNKQRHEFDTHVKQHILAGESHTSKIFASRKFQTTPKVISETKMKARPPPTIRTTTYVPKVRPLKMKQLFERKVPKIEIKREPGTESPTDYLQETKPQSQAYFCRKCYQVFFKLDEFNVHVVNCKGTAFKNVSPPLIKYPPQLMERTPKYAEREAEKFSPTGRPMRNCVREIGTYADDAVEEIEIPLSQMKKFPAVKSSRGYECAMCSSCFPTVHSRNSHMRIHKAAIQQLNSLSRKSINIIKPKTENIAKKVVNVLERQNQSYAKYMNDVKVKQEPMEPIVEIHEQPNNYPSSIGAVSITPIPNASHKSGLDPNIMKLVKNNPNLTIKSMADHNKQQQQLNNSMPNLLDGDAKCYRCLSCSKPFANKSNLYFHKKNQCSGSKYPCPFCKKRFGTEAAYSSHIFYNHPE